MTKITVNIHIVVIALFGAKDLNDEVPRSLKLHGKCTKFNPEQLLFEAFFDGMRIFGSI